ncbi:MAG: hypothetical protein QOE70_1679 [Chthoniobacter sp.]|jgi:hypothetical protein|nr:hypothetical protein [Chthoniobacter sp.]
MLSNSQRLAAALSLTFLVGGAVGYLAGHRVPPAESASTSRTLDTGGPSRPSPRWAENHRNEPERGAVERPAEALSADADLAGSILAAVRARDYFRRRHDIYAVGQQLGRDTIRAALEATQQFSEADRENAQYSLLARWLELDPAAAYEWVGARSKQSQRSALTREFFHSLGLKDPATALTFLNQSRAGPNRGEDFTYSVFEAWSTYDPSAAVEAALSLQKKESRGSALGIALGRWAKRDPQGALARVAQIADAEMRGDQLRTVLREWAEEDPQAAAGHALGLPAGKERNDALASVISGTAATDHEAAMRLIEQMPAGTARNLALMRIVSDLGYKEPKVAAEFVLALPPGQQRSSMYQVVTGLARQDRAAALEWAGRLTSGEARAAAVQRIVQEWSSTDPKAAAEYCVSNALGTPEIVGNAVTNWARNDPREALAWAVALPAGAPREAALASGIAVLGASDPQQAANLATTLLNGPKQAQALGSIAGAWAAKDPGAAAAWAGQLSDSSTRENAVSNVASAWARQDPAAAAAWASRTPETGQALSTITREWAAQDSTAAAKWLDTLPSGGARDSAVMSFSQVMADADPEGAAAWAATISQPQQRDNAIGEVFRQWKRADSKSAGVWLRATPALSEEARERMLRWEN